MPELPEVETVLRTLEKQIKDYKIKDIDILYRPIINENIIKFKKSLIGQHFRKFIRRGKYLLFEMDDIVLVSHLRMEGKYYIKNTNEEIEKHTHVIFKLNNSKDLRYNDVRKFGRFELLEKKDNYDVFKNLGPEPFSKDFNANYVKKYFYQLKKPLKEVLLDQSFVSGVGNIYADEICFSIKIKPTTPCYKLKDDIIKELIKNTKSILKKAIKAGGTTIRSYTSSLGVTGRFQLKLKVHTLSCCQICGSKIKKIRVGGKRDILLSKMSKIR